MKRLKAFITASLASAAAVFSAAAPIPCPPASAADQVNIMPIGDSITFGLGEDGGYRKYLDYTLRSMDIEFDMVGPEGKNSDSFTYNGQRCEYDGNHAGYSGYTIRQKYPIPNWGENGLLEKLQSKDAIKNAQPDIVLLIIGTNDMTANRDLAECDEDLHDLIDYILADMPENGVIFMGSIPEFTAYGGNEQRVGNYNKTVQRVAESYGDNVRFADVHGCLDGMNDMSNDNLHPSGKGYEKMGKFWAGVIEEYLGAGGGSSEPVPDSPEILRSDFEKGLSGWQARGSTKAAQSTDEAAEGLASAAVTGRTNSWNGISYSLSSKKCPAGTEINVSAKVMQKSGDTVRFKMTMQYSDGEKTIYDTFAEIDAGSGKWVTISAKNYVMPEGSDAVLYIETDTDLCDFYLDDVLVMKSDGAAVSGDVNDDGELSAADLVLVEKWLMGVPDTELANGDSGDLNGDGRLDAFDLCLMRQRLIGDK